MAATWPSIIALGATKSAPARAWLTAVSASRTSRRVVVDDPSAASGPQWPWSVYSHRHVSAIVTMRQVQIGGSCAQRLLNDPVLVRGARAQGVLVVGEPEQDHPADTRGPPDAATSSTATSGESRATPGMDAIGSRMPLPGRTKSGATSIEGCEPGLADEGADRGRPAQAARTMREGGRCGLCGRVGLARHGGRRRVEIDASWCLPRWIR